MSDDPVLDLCRLWWDKAGADLAAARRLPDLPAICGFHCQQAVEKAIIGWAVQHIPRETGAS